MRFHPFNVLRVGLPDHLLNNPPLFSLERFVDEFIAILGFQCYIVTQCGTFFQLTVSAICHYIFKEYL